MGRGPLFIYLFVQRACFTYYDCITNYSKSWWRKTTIYYAHRFCGSGFGQSRVGSACLCSILSGPQLEAFKAEGWNHLEAHSLTCRAVNTGCQLGPGVPLHLGFCIWSLGLKSWFEFITIWWQSSKGKHPKGESQR